MLIILLTLFLVNCAQFNSKKYQDEQENKLRSHLEEIDLSDGVNQEEAKHIAANYHYLYVKASFGLIKPIEKKRNWEIGFAADVVPISINLQPILINKATGQTSWPDNGPTIINPKEMWNTNVR